MPVVTAITVQKKHCVSRLKTALLTRLASVTLDSFALTSFTNSFGVDFARLPLATVLGQVRQHSIHAVELGSIN